MSSGSKSSSSGRKASPNFRKRKIEYNDHKDVAEAYVRNFAKDEDVFDFKKFNMKKRGSSLDPIALLEIEAFCNFSLAIWPDCRADIIHTI